MSDIQKVWEWSCAAKATADRMEHEADRFVQRLAWFEESKGIFDIGGRHNFLSASLFRIDGEIDGLWGRMASMQSEANRIRAKAIAIKADAVRLRAAANERWPAEVGRTYGDVTMGYDSFGSCTLSSGEVFEFPEKTLQVNPYDMDAAFAYCGGQTFAKGPRG